MNDPIKDSTKIPTPKFTELEFVLLFLCGIMIFSWFIDEVTIPKWVWWLICSFLFVFGVLRLSKFLGFVDKTPKR